MKKLISLLLTAVMLLSAFSLVSSADDMDWPFTDVKDTAWYYEGIAYCYYNGIVSGMTESTFVPNGTLTRAQFVQILAMFAGADLDLYKNADSGFNDVKTKHWFNAPVCWAVEQGFVKGLSETKFGPNNPITREQLARLLYLFGQSIELDMTPRADLLAFADESKVSSWAYEPVQWAVAVGIISGMTENTVAPKATATRAQACRMIMAFDEYVYLCSRDMSGAYAVIVEYIKANGEYLPEYSVHSYFREFEGYYLAMEYVESDQSISIAYLTEPYEYEEDGSTWNGYREFSALYAYTLGSSYDFMYLYENPNGTDYMSTAGYLALDSYDELESSLEGYESAELSERSTRAQAYIKEHIALILAEADMTLEDFFLPEEDTGEEMQQIYDALVRYVYDKGEEYPDGSAMGLITDNGNEAYVFEYVPETGETCLVYVTEPIPGGNDIFDTSYRERMIFLPDILSGSLWWQYTYESEDGTVKISASGTDADEDNYSNLTFEGISEEEAKAMCDAAMENTALHYLDLITDAASYIIYDGLVDYVSSNGIADADSGMIDLIKDNGDKAYVAEYDPVNDALYFVYVSEPVPGGNDIYDTLYREKAILMLDPPLTEEYFSYVYENEDSSVKIEAEGYYDSVETQFEKLELTGVSEEEGTVKIRSALEEAMSYFVEILEETTVA